MCGIDEKGQHIYNWSSKMKAREASGEALLAQITDNTFKEIM